MNDKSKINRSIRFYPFFEGITNDLLFFISIETLLFRDIKQLSSTQINILYFAGVFSVLMAQPLTQVVVRKIGRLTSVRLSTLMLLCAASIFTFFNSFAMTVIAQILYVNAYSFKSMSGIILANNLKALNRFDEYVDYQNRASLLYSVVTFVIALIVGPLYNISVYVPMALCVLCVLAGIGLSFFLYDNEVETVQSEKVKVSFSKEVKTSLLVYGLIFALITAGQNNSSLFLENTLAHLYEPAKKVLVYTYMIAFGRIIRIAFSFFYPKIYRRLKSKTLLLAYFSFVACLISALLGHCLQLGFISALMIALSYYTFVSMRDSFDNYMRRSTLSSCPASAYTAAFFALIRYRKTCEAAFNAISAITLALGSYEHLFIILLIASLVDGFFVFKVYREHAKRKQA